MTIALAEDMAHSKEKKILNPPSGWNPGFIRKSMEKQTPLYISKACMAYHGLTTAGGNLHSMILTV